MAEIFEVKVRDAEVLKGWYWPADEAQSNLVIITGMCEYAYRYAPFAEWMNGNRVNVWCLDAFGQGLNASSEDMQQRWPENAFAHTVVALRRLVAKAGENGLPTFLMGHSMGSFMVQSFMERFHDCTSGIILCGSNGGQAGLMKMGYRLAKSIVHDHNWYQPSPILEEMALGAYGRMIRDRETDYDWLSYNKDNVNAYMEDSWCGHKSTGGFWKEFMKGLSTIWDEKEMRKISRNENILIISGEDDPVGRMGKGPVWLWKKYRNLGIRGTNLKLYPEMRHEILNETDPMKVYGDILNFVTPGYQ